MHGVVVVVVRLVLTGWNSTRGRCVPIVYRILWGFGATGRLCGRVLVVLWTPWAGVLRRSMIIPRRLPRFLRLAWVVVVNMNLCFLSAFLVICVARADEIAATAPNAKQDHRSATDHASVLHTLRVCRILRTLLHEISIHIEFHITFVVCH